MKQDVITIGFAKFGTEELADEYLSDGPFRTEARKAGVRIGLHQLDYCCGTRDQIKKDLRGRVDSNSFIDEMVAKIKQFKKRFDTLLIFKDIKYPERLEGLHPAFMAFDTVSYRKGSGEVEDFYGNPTRLKLKTFVFFGDGIARPKRYFLHAIGDDKDGFCKDFGIKLMDTDFSELYSSRTPKPIRYFLDQTAFSESQKRAVAALAKKAKFESGNVLFFLGTNGVLVGTKPKSQSPDGTVRFLGRIDG